MKTIVRIAAVAALSLSFATVATADVIKERQQGFKNHADNIKAAKTAIEGGDVAGAVEPATAMAAFASTIPSLFPAGSGEGETRAMPAIWTDWAGFEKAAMDNKAAAENLAKVAATGDAGAAGEALKAVGASCGGCHKPFRKPKE